MTNPILQSKMLEYGQALGIQYNYMNQFRDYDDIVNGTITYVDFACLEDLDAYTKKYRAFNKDIDTEYSPDLSDEEIDKLKDPDLFTKLELLLMVNELLIEKFYRDNEEHE